MNSVEQPAECLAQHLTSGKQATGQDALMKAANTIN